MAKKVSWDNLPQVTAQVLDILLSENSQQLAVPELRQRLILLERKIDDLHDLVSPDRPTMELPAVCRILKIKPKEAYNLAENGTLPYKTAGRKALFYQDGVVKYYMSLPAWVSAISAPSSTETPADSIPEVDKKQIDVTGASQLLGRSESAIRQLASKGRIPYRKEKGKLVFIVCELLEWSQSNTPRKRKNTSTGQ